jgi:Putative adhesin
MKKFIGLLLVCAASLAAQDGVEKVTVPLHDPSRPARVHAQLNTGGITVRGYDGKEVLVEAHARPGGEHHSTPQRADGMRRLELPGNAGLDVTEDDNLVNIRTSSWNHPVELVISVPRKSSLELKCMNDGDIVVEHVEGEIDANNLNGRVTLKNISGSALAHSLNGEVLVTFDRIDPSKPMSFSTLNGDIDVTLPDSTKATVKIKTDHGDIYSDFDVKLDPSASLRTESGNVKDGTFRVHIDRTLRGSVNGGGPEFQFTSFNGQIYIRKKK